MKEMEEDTKKKLLHAYELEELNINMSMLPKAINKFNAIPTKF